MKKHKRLSKWKIVENKFNKVVYNAKSKGHQSIPEAKFVNQNTFTVYQRVFGIFWKKLIVCQSYDEAARRVHKMVAEHRSTKLETATHFDKEGRVVKSNSDMFT